jgi:hypothetical protein
VSPDCRRLHSVEGAGYAHRRIGRSLSHGERTKGQLEGLCIAPSALTSPRRRASCTPEHSIARADIARRFPAACEIYSRLWGRRGPRGMLSQQRPVAVDRIRAEWRSAYRTSATGLRPTPERDYSMSVLSIKDQQALDALRNAVAEALERKRRLGQYAVIWRDGHAVRIEPAEIATIIDSENEKKRALRAPAPNAEHRSASSPGRSD